MRVGALDHAALLVGDVERSLGFYRDALGLEEVARPASFTFPGAWVRVGGQELHLIGEERPGRARELQPGVEDGEAVRGYATHVALSVEDLDAALEEVGLRGVRPAGPVRERGDGVRQAYLTDPDGHLVELLQLPGGGTA